MPKKVFVMKMGAPTAAQKAARRISQATIDLIVKSAAHKAAREALAVKPAARKAEKIGLIDRNNPADNVRAATLDLSPTLATPVPSDVPANAGIEDKIMATLRASRKR